MGYFQSTHAWASHSRLLAVTSDRSLKSYPTKEFWSGTKVIYCWFYFLLFAYCFVFVSRLFIDLFKMQKERHRLEIQTFFKPLLPTFVTFRSLLKSRILALLSKEGLSLIYPNGENTYHAVGKNIGFGGLGTYFSCMLLAWLFIIYVPQLSRMWNGDSIVVKCSFM